MIDLDEINLSVRVTRANARQTRTGKPTFRKLQNRRPTWQRQLDRYRTIQQKRR